MKVITNKRELMKIITRQGFHLHYIET